MPSPQLISEVASDLWSIPISTLPALGAQHFLGETLWALQGRSGNLSPITSGQPHPPLGGRSCSVMRQCALFILTANSRVCFLFPSSL